MIQNHFFRRLLLLICTCCLWHIGQAQTISGKVSNENNEPMPGVTVRVLGTSVMTNSKADGLFNIEARQGDTLAFSHIGYNDLLQKIQGSNVQVTMIRSSDDVLSDVVVVGYGTQKKASLSGSISTINKKDLENRPVNNAVQALQGLSPGLVITRSSGQPGYEKWNVNIRGIASLNGTNTPLLIVDGVEYPDLTMINPDDIDNISVLKDASASAIYGAKAASGVLLITTKSGRAGRVSVNYTGMVQVRQPLSLPKTVPYHLSAAIQNQANIANGGAPSYTEQQIAQFKDPNITMIPDDPTNIFYYEEMDYIGMAINKQFTTSSHNINVSGGNEKTQYYIGLGYNDNKGMFKAGPDGNKRYNARMNLNTKLNKVFSIDARVAFTQNKVQAAAGTLEGDYNLLYNIYNLRPITPIYVPGSDGTKFLSGVNTIAALKEGGYNNTEQNILDGVFTLKAANFVRGLELSANYSPHLELRNQDMFFKTVPLYTFNKAQQTFVQNSWVNRSNSINKYRTTQSAHTTNFLANYDLQMNDHHFHVLGGYQYQFYNYDRLNATQTNLINNNLPTVNYTTNSTLPVTAILDDLQTNAWVSYFGRLNYDYKNKYFVEATVRNDASSRLAPGYREQTFPAVSVAWRVTQEDWFSGSLISELKLRASWGKLGNAQLGEPYQSNYMYATTLKTGVYPFNNAATTYIYQEALPSEAIGWETVETKDIGVDFGLFANRLTGSFDYYQRANNNMLIPVNLPAVLGVLPSTSNAAAMETKGWDLEMGWRDRAGSVTYSVGFNLSDNKNEITKYLGNVVYKEGLNVALPGYPVNSIFGYKSIGYFQSPEEVANSPKQFGATNQGPGDIKYLNVDGNNVINGGTGTPDDHGDLVYLGNTSPRYNFGINLGAQYKGFDLSVILQGTGKRSLIIYSYQAIPFLQSWRYPLDNYIDNYWTEDNRNARFPRPIAGGGTNTHVNSAFVQNGSYIRLKNLQVGYTLPQSVLSRIHIQKVRIFFSGQDIWTKTKMWYRYFDPESPNDAAYTYPFSSSYAFGINVGF